MNQSLLIKLKLTCLGILLSFAVKATHIVGGEIYLTYLSGSNFTLGLNLYFDQINGNAGANDSELTLYVYRKSNNSLVQSFVLPKNSQQSVDYSNNACQSTQLRTLIINYRANVNLSTFTDPQGYYVVWERCCRNGVIGNIINPGDAASTFYLEFPAVGAGGAYQNNSSPTFATPQGDYLCIGKNFTANFGATDPDGDDLVYSLVTPYNGVTTDTNPVLDFPPDPYPYPPSTISWQSGYNANNAITSGTGSPLSISSTGVLSVNPNRVGLHVFSVRVEEYRGGVKIGEVRRDFQFLVLVCEDNTDPVVNIPLPDPNNPGSIINYVEGEELVLDLNVSNCLTLNITDSPDEFIENITFQPVDFNLDESPLSATSITINSSGQANIDFCWQDCELNDPNTNYNFNIIVRDDGCPSKGDDTLQVRLKVISKNNIQPQLAVLASSSQVTGGLNNLVFDVQVNEFLFVDLLGQDFNNDSLKISLITEQGNENLGFSYTNQEGIGTTEARFEWTPSCELISQNGQNNSYTFNFLLEEITFSCEPKADTLQLTININDDEVNFDGFLPPNVFTPNSDNSNRYFQMPNLPKENCIYEFKSIKIYNRWGKKVFESSDRDFKWSGDNFPAGMYFYIIDYKSREYKGTVSILL